jgi:hypothetical protein
MVLIVVVDSGAVAVLADDSGAVKERLLSWIRTRVRSSSMAWKYVCFRLLNSTKVGAKPARVKEIAAVNVTAFY